MKIAVIALIVTVVIAGVAVGLAPRAAECAYCYSGDCYNSSICGHGCACLIPGGQFKGKCYSSGFTSDR